MSPELDQLVSEVAELIGVAKPGWLESDAPSLAQTNGGKEADRFYLIGLIGGKDVGKSALVNAIVGQQITAQTSHGPGTETVIAYAHANQSDPLRELLEREVPGRYRIVEHNVPRLFRQVLLDLPDIDSHWADHVTVTRKMLRHMLFPIWVQSIEKYADRQPQQLLAKVAAGNSPGNFVFCLNKVDQLDQLEKPPAGLTEPATDPIHELQSDYAIRLQKVLSLEHPPQVWAISALHPDRYDLPPLRNLLAQQKTEEAVRESKAKAAARQRSSVLEWLAAQDLPARAARLARLCEEAEEFINERLGIPLLETALPRLTEDPLYRQSVLDDCLSKRIARWPIVNILHGLFATIGAFLRRNAEPVARPLSGNSGEALVDQHLAAFSAPSNGRTLTEMIQTTFALLQQSHPPISPLYAERKLWESIPATIAARELREGLIGTVNRQRSVACSRVDRNGGGTLAAATRALLTIGALLWFPFIQPVVKGFLANARSANPSKGPPDFLMIFVDLLDMSYLLKALSFLLIYFSVIWLVLRWDTQRRVGRQFARWRRLENMDPPLSLVGCTLEWLANLIGPVRVAQEKMDRIVERVKEL